MKYSRHFNEVIIINPSLEQKAGLPHLSLEK